MDSTISGNVASAGEDSGAGGIRAQGRVVVTDSSVVDNRADYVGGISADGDVTITSSVISNNRGGGISSYGPVIVQESTISENNASGGDGGGIQGRGDVTIINSLITGNHAGYYGGGVSGGNVTISGSTISGNTAWERRGGVYGEYVTVTTSTISGNSVSRGSGGGIFADLTVVITSSTISGSSVTDGVGGGISAQSVAMTKSTVSGNSVTGGSGGGIFANQGMTIHYSTIVGNSATSSGGGIVVPAVDPTVQTVSVVGSIVAGNFSSDNVPDIGIDLSTPRDIRFSLIGDNTGTGLAEAPIGSPDANGNLIGDPRGSGAIAPRLGPLANNGGKTQTHALLPGSPAINAGDPEASTLPSYDQRGAPFKRLGNHPLDMGSYELQPSPADFFTDGILNCADVDLLAAAIASGDDSVLYDLNGDAIVDRDDLDVWLSLAGLENLSSHAPYQHGDANLDGAVDTEGFDIWIAHQWKPTTAWCSANFNGDPYVDVADFNIWNQNNFQGTQHSHPATTGRLPRAPLNSTLTTAQEVLTDATLASHSLPRRAIQATSQGNMIGLMTVRQPTLNDHFGHNQPWMRVKITRHKMMALRDATIDFAFASLDRERRDWTTMDNVSTPPKKAFVRLAAANGPQRLMQ